MKRHRPVGRGLDELLHPVRAGIADLVRGAVINDFTAAVGVYPASLMRITFNCFMHRCRMFSSTLLVPTSMAFSFVFTMPTENFPSLRAA